MEKLNMVGKVLLEKQTSLKPLAALSKDDPICFVTNIKFMLPFLVVTFLLMFVNHSF